MRIASASYNRGLLPMKLIALPAFTDDPTWMLHAGAQALRVVPSDVATVPAEPADARLQLAGILVTRHAVNDLAGDCRTV